MKHIDNLFNNLFMHFPPCSCFPSGKLFFHYITTLVYHFRISVTVFFANGAYLA